ncbi:jg605 [Pararge aegeria aegeria]|uniref:Jg605 protein n=1 Tax=Pararge aegeria aegeria TaxID=348720 RepID=A0A8S4QQB8_9NEOP|nr:jg605 [Pararge aegeria aegeria]
MMQFSARPERSASCFVASGGEPPVWPALLPLAITWRAITSDEATPMMKSFILKTLGKHDLSTQYDNYYK